MESRTSERAPDQQLCSRHGISQESRARYPHIYGPPSAVEVVARLHLTSFRHSMLVKSISVLDQRCAWPTDYNY
jgi:hypothetical protein